MKSILTIFNPIRISFVILLFLFQFITINSNAQTTRVLFIGNSLTGTNNLPNQFKLLAQSAGKQIYVEDATAGGATLQNHLNNAGTITKIQQGNWDYVVLQEQSQLPSWTNQRDSLFFPYAKSLDSIINIYNPCGSTLFFLTYAHRNGDLGIIQNGGSDTYLAMQQRIRNGYMEIADSLNAVVCPVGWAFRECRLQFPNIELYMPDHNHPTDTGTYLAACTFYSTIFQDSAIGKSYIGNMTSAKALTLQTIASHIVMDSLSLWNIAPIANGNTKSNFYYTNSLLTVSFYDSSSNVISNFWNFGDNTISTAHNPVHTYSNPGSYNVTMISYGSCGSDTSTKQITVYPYNTAPICHFNYSSSNYSYSFNDSSQNANSYYWEFGDGDTSTAINPTHIYKSAGVFTVKHRVYNAFGKDSLNKQITIIAQPPIADFNYIFSASLFTVDFFDSSQFSNTVYWQFGDGDTSTQTNPIHTFPGDNTYIVKLKVSNNWGIDSVSKQLIINYSGFDQLMLNEQIKIFPNPLYETLHISTDIEHYYVELRSIDNAILYKSTESKDTKVDLSTLPKGFFILVIQSEELIIVKKLIKN